MSFNLPGIQAPAFGITHVEPVIAIYNASNGVKMFPTGLVMEASVDPEIFQATHPIESGATQTDFRVIKPIELEVVLYFDYANYKNGYQQVVTAFTNATLLNVQLRTGYFYNLVLMGIPHREDPDRFDAIIVTLKLRTANFANTTVTTFKPAIKSDASTVPRGTQQNIPAAPVQTKTATLSGLQALKRWALGA